MILFYLIQLILQNFVSDKDFVKTKCYLLKKQNSDPSV